MTIAVITALVLLTSFSCSGIGKGGRLANVDTIPDMVMQIQKCSKLYVCEYKVHKIVTHSDKVRMKGAIIGQEYDIALPVGERRIAIPMYATLKAYIDFSNFSKENIRKVGNKIEIICPDPRITLTSTKIDHAEIKRNVAFLRQDFSDEELQSYQKQGREAIIGDIPSMGIAETARKSASLALIPILEKLGFQGKDITITFSKQFNAGDYKSFIVM